MLTENVNELTEKKKHLRELGKKLSASYANADANKNKLATISLTQLYDECYESHPPIIENFLYPGTYVFAGASKIGKSFLAAQIAFHVANGFDYWEQKTTQGTVLYVSLEDTYQRLQKRMYQMFEDASSDKLFFCTDAKPLGDGLEEQIENFITEHPDTNLIIIDTLQKIRGADNEKERGTYAGDYDTISKLKKISDEKGICILLIHHTRKQKSKDPFDMINGTNGIMGCADGAMIFVKDERGSNNAKLFIAGRDQPDTIIEVTKNTDTLIWEAIIFDTEVWRTKPDPLFMILAGRIKDNGGTWEGSATELVTFLNAKLKPNSMTKKLNVNCDILKDCYGLIYRNIRNHDGRKITFESIPDFVPPWRIDATQEPQEEEYCDGEEQE